MLTGTILGIDSGIHGAIAVLTENGALLTVVDMPSAVVKVGKSNKTRVMPQALALFIAAHKPVHAYVEAVHAMPGQGVSSMFAFGQAFGQVEGVLAALGVPITYVTPTVWKKAMQVSALKGSSRTRAMQLWPAQAAEFVRVRDADKAEACLLALYGLRQYTAQTP